MEMNESRKDSVVQSKTGIADHRAGKYLTFRLANEEYGLEILKVREIIGLMDITRVPKTPEFIRGVINLRGKVIPVVELRLKFGMEAKQDTDETCIIVVDIAGETGSVLMGILVDAVSEVLDIQPEEIEDPPSFGAGFDTRFILGIGKVKNTVKLLLDIDRVLTGVEVSGLEGYNETQEMNETSALAI
jgi:purine-binding chemotaxis protein CheW